MISIDSSLNDLKNLVKSCLEELNENDEELFKRKKWKGVSERSFGFRIAHYLQNKLEKDKFFVDCDFNSSNQGKRKRDAKLILDPEGGETGRFIDIIVHRRDRQNNYNLFCIEIKKWNNKNKKDRDKDRNNLRRLTSSKYRYHYGFHIIIHKEKTKSEWSIFDHENRDPEYKKIF